MTATLVWTCCSFDDLTARQVHDILRLRSGIFQIEQNSLYADIDGEDVRALHLFATDPATQEVLAAARLFVSGGLYKGVVQDCAWIGRVVVAASQRGQGLGHQLMRACVAELRARDAEAVIVLSAQAHLRNFYAAHGFVAYGDLYDEDDIPHIKMRLT